MNQHTENVKIEIEFAIRFKKLSNGWWEATSRYGDTCSYSKEDCIRILSVRARA